MADKKPLYLDAGVLKELGGSDTISVALISGVSEAVDDRVAALLVQGTGVSLSYNDAANTLTVGIGQDVATTASPTFDTVTLASNGPYIAPTYEYWQNDITVFTAGNDLGFVAVDGTPISLIWSNNDTGNGRFEFRTVGGTALPVYASSFNGVHIGNGSNLTALNAGNIASGILAGARGGTANGFMQFSGPASSLKTFTLPNASATILTSNAAVTVAQGGTGVATLTGVAIGSGTSNFSAATSSTTGQVLRCTGANTFAFGQLDLANSSAITGTLGGGNGGTGTTSFGAANRIPYATSTTALTNSSNFTYDGSTFSVLSSGGIVSNTATFTITYTGSISGSTNDRYGLSVTATDNRSYTSSASGRVVALRGYARHTAIVAGGPTLPTVIGVEGLADATTAPGTSTNTYVGGRFVATGNTAGTALSYGVEARASGSDENYAIRAFEGYSAFDNGVAIGPGKPAYAAYSNFALHLNSSTTQAAGIPLRLSWGDPSSAASYEGTDLTPHGYAVYLVNNSAQAHNFTTLATGAGSWTGSGGDFVFNPGNSEAFRIRRSDKKLCAKKNYIAEYDVELGYNDITLLEWGVDQSGYANLLPHRLRWSNYDTGNGAVMFDSGVDGAYIGIMCAALQATSIYATGVIQTTQYISVSRSTSGLVYYYGSSLGGSATVIACVQNRITTTSASTTTLHTFAVGSGVAYSLYIRVLARRTGGSGGASGDYAVYERTIAVRNEGGTVTVNGSASAVDITAIYENQSGWAVDAIQSSSNVLIRVTGAANNNITWQLVKLEYSALSS